METKEQKQFNSLDYFNDKVTDLELYNSEYKMIEDAFEEAKKIYKEELKKAYKNGFLRCRELFNKSITVDDLMAASGRDIKEISINKKSNVLYGNQEIKID